MRWPVEAEAGIAVTEYDVTGKVFWFGVYEKSYPLFTPLPKTVSIKSAALDPTVPFVSMLTKLVG